MKNFLSLTGLIVLLFIYAVVPVNGQATANTKVKTGLFDNDEVLNITISGNIKDLLNDRSDNDPYRPQMLLYKNADSTEVSLPVEAKTRGHFRKMRENCIYPPLLIHFINDAKLPSSVFKGQDKLKMVMPCLTDGYVIKEYLLYKIYNLITPKSLKAKLLKVSLIDTKSNKEYKPFYTILLEDEEQMAQRNNVVVIKRKIYPQDTDTSTFLTMAVFEFMIANTDWSVEYLQNIKLVNNELTGVAEAVPYDFDHAGLVNAPYAKPAEALLMSSVRERRYRGYCVKELKFFESTIATFNLLKNDIYNLYAGCTLLDAKYIKSTLQYLDEFYATINNPKAWQKEFSYPCDKNGTGNVVIKGLSKERF